MAEKEVFQHLAEFANGRISIDRMLKWPNPEQVDLHSRALVSVHLLWFGQFHCVIVELRRDYRTVVKILISSKKNDDFL
jgi:hypothetical protein